MSPRKLSDEERIAALVAENTRLQAAVESGATLLRIATRALGFYAEPGRWSHEPQGWAWAVTDEGPERAARAIESIRAKSPASDKQTIRKPLPESMQSGLPGPHENCEHEHRVCVAGNGEWSTGKPRDQVPIEFDPENGAG